MDLSPANIARLEHVLGTLDFTRAPMPRFVPMGISGSVRSRAASGNARPRCAARSGRRRWSGWRSTVNTWRHHRYRGTRSVSSICTPERTVGGHVTNGAANASV